MYLRFVLLLMSITMMLCGGITSTLGPAAIPYQVRNVFLVTWVIRYPTYAFFGSVVVFIAALLYRPGKALYVNDFAS